MSFSFGVKSLFSPDDDVAAEILKEVGSAQSSILMMIYGFTLVPLVDLLIAKHQAGITVQLVLDKTQAAGKTESLQVERLKAAGVDFVIGTSPKAHQIMHEKGICIDNVHVITGSYNFSASAANQVNHCDFIYSKDRADWFTKQFASLRDWIVTNEPQQPLVKK